MLVKDIIKVIEEFAPLSNQESWDNCGLCMGSENAVVTGVLLALDCTEETVDEAIRKGLNLIVTHHPMIFSGVRKICPDNWQGRIIIKAASFGINIYAAHTSADKVAGGVSFAMAARLGLSDVEILDKDGNGNGLGAVGNLGKHYSLQEMVAFVKDRFRLQALRCSRPDDIPISRVAVCGGSGSSLIGKAMASGAQLYITGDISYHHFFTEKGFMLMDIGHYESEIDIVDILFSLIKKNFPTFAVCITENIYSNPIFYF
ncbi:MAG: Nif3-like dinuclear metal center hexameric protein [Bacteroidales bacterium]|nr:Nif3-like dinuclear metal center hexameric protein [Bacteroidales bacterium]